MKVKDLHRCTSHSTIQDQFVLIWWKEVQVLCLEMLHVNSSQTKQQQDPC